MKLSINWVKNNFFFRKNIVFFGKKIQAALGNICEKLKKIMFCLKKSEKNMIFRIFFYFKTEINDPRKMMLLEKKRS